jgi:iron complex outermembrane recepter protein
MSNDHFTRRSKSRGAHEWLTNFLPTPIALAVGIILLTPIVANAQDTRSTAEIQAEVDRLKDVLEQRQRAEATDRVSAANAAAAAVTTADAVLAADAATDSAMGSDSSSASLDELTVSASARIPVSRDAPQSISVVTGADLQLQDVVDMGGILRRATNVKWNAGNSREFSFSIRGLGYQQNTEAMDPDVGFTLDGVPYAYNPLSSFDFVDVDNVEVLRGPQGTAGGKNAILGVINLTTREPTFTPETSYSVAYGERQSVIASAVIGGPLLDDLLAWRTVISVDKEGGYIKNLYNTSESYGNRDRVSARTQFLLTPTSDFRALLRVDVEPSGSEFYNGMTIYTPTPTVYSNGKPNPLTTDASTRLARSWFTQQNDYSYTADYLYGAGQNAVDNNSQRPLITDSLGGSLQLDWKLGANSLTSISAYKQYSFYASNDEGTPFDVTTASGGGVQYHQLSQEIRLDSAKGGLVEYRTGLYLLSSQTQGPVSVSKNGWGSDAGAWFANAAQYTTLDGNGAGRTLLVDSLDGLRKAGFEDDEKKSAALYAQADWHLTDPLTLVTGVRATYEQRKTDNNALLTAEGYGADLNPVAVNGVQLDGFGSDKNGALLSTDTAQQVALANLVAQQYFNAASYSALTAAQRKQIAAAKALRLTQIGVLWNTVQAQPFDKVQPTLVFSPTYKINETLSSYFSFQHGEKAGISQTVNGVSYLAQPEKSNAFEIGVKSFLFDRALSLNADVYLNNIRNYQQAVQVFDAYTTVLNHDGTNYYTSATGNAAKVQAKGVEVDATYDGIPYTLVRFTGAYNDAVYKDFKNAGKPVEAANQTAPYRDATGMVLPGAAKYTFDVDVSFRRTVFQEKDFFASVDTSFTSDYNSDVAALSAYAWIPAHSSTDVSIGVGRSDRKFDLSLLVKNAFNDQTPLAQTWDSYTPAPPRWTGVMMTGKF